MSLFNDGTVSTMDDLTAYDSSLLDVASTEGIDVTRKLSLARDEVATALNTLLPQTFTTLGLDNLVVTTPLRLWHTFLTLALVYEDAYYSQLNDRYQNKWKAYVERARWAQEKLMQAGAGFVSNPVPRAQPPVLATAPFSQPAATYFAAVSWVNPQGEEGVPSENRSLSVDAGSSIQVTAAAKPANVVGWNVYLGYSPDGINLQNELPLDPNAPWIFRSTALVSGRVPGSGQQPDFLRALPRVLHRG